MTNPFKIFLIKKEERWLAATILLVFVVLQALFIASEYRWYTMGAPGGFWSIFTKHYRMSGYDCWSWITISGMRIHFHDLDPNWAVNHAYNVASYLLTSSNEIESGETIDGIKDGKMDQSVQWKCQYEDALIQPNRLVLDINTGEYASGNRE